MKRFTIIILVVALSFSLIGCMRSNEDIMQTAESERVETTAPTQETTEPTVKILYSIMTDEELLRRLCDVNMFESIMVSSLYFPSEKAIQHFGEKYPEFAELYQRETMLETLNGYGVKLAEAYLASSDSKDRSVGGCLDMFITKMNFYASK